MAWLHLRRIRASMLGYRSQYIESNVSHAAKHAHPDIKIQLRFHISNTNSQLE